MADSVLVYIVCTLCIGPHLCAFRALKLDRRAMTAAPLCSRGFRIHSMRAGIVVAGIAIAGNGALEQSGHVFGQQWADSHQAGTDHGGVDFEDGPYHHVGATPWYLVTTRMVWYLDRNTYMLRRGIGLYNPLCTSGGPCSLCKHCMKSETARDKKNQENDTYKEPKANMKMTASFFLGLRLRPFNSRIGSAIITRSSTMLNAAPE